MDELIKKLGLSTEQATALKDFVAKEQEANTTKLTTEKGKYAAIVQEKKDLQTKFEALETKFHKVIDAFDVNESDDDIEDAISSAKSKLTTAGDKTTADAKELQRQITTLTRENKKLLTEHETATKTLIELKTKTANQAIRQTLLQKLTKAGVIKPDQMVDMFVGKAKFDEANENIFMLGSDGAELGVEDFVSDWAKNNPEFISVKVKGGAGSGTGGVVGGNDEDEGHSPQLKQYFEAKKNAKPINTGLNKMFGLPNA